MLQVRGARLLQEAAREAEALASFCHPNIVRLYAAFVWEDAAVLVVEYGGETLSRLPHRPSPAKAWIPCFFSVAPPLAAAVNLYIAHVNVALLLLSHRVSPGGEVKSPYCIDFLLSVIPFLLSGEV